MTRLPLADIVADPFHRLLGHRPEILEAWRNLDRVMLGPSSTLPLGLKEEARRALAQNIGCAFCATVGGQPMTRPANPAIALAVSFASQVSVDHQQIDDSTFDVLREEFSDTQIAELVMWICFKYGSNLLGAIVKLEPATEAEIDGYSEFLNHATT